MGILNKQFTFCVSSLLLIFYLSSSCSFDSGDDDSIRAYNLKTKAGCEDFFVSKESLDSYISFINLSNNNNPVIQVDTLCIDGHTVGYLINKISGW